MKEMSNFDRPPLPKEPRLSKRELCRLLKTDLLDVYIITQVLRGTSLNLYCVLLTFADLHWKCKFTQRQLLSLTAIANNQTLQKQERWLEDLKLIKKYQFLGDRTGSLYRVHSLNVLPLSEEITSQLGDYLLPYEQLFLRQREQLIQAKTDVLDSPTPTDVLESTAASSAVVDHSVAPATTSPAATETTSKVAKIRQENGKVYKRVEYGGPGDIKMYDYYEDDVAVIGGFNQPAPPDDECLEAGPD